MIYSLIYSHRININEVITPLFNLVGGFNPFEKCACQIESFPQVRVKIKHV